MGDFWLDKYLLRHKMHKSAPTPRILWCISSKSNTSAPSKMFKKSKQTTACYIILVSVHVTNNCYINKTLKIQEFNIQPIKDE